MDVFGYSLGVVIQFFIGLFFTITFIDSGFDKLINYKKNLKWIKSHFAKTFLDKSVPLLLIILTLLELLSGFLSGFGVLLLFSGYSHILLCGLLFSTATLIALFFGQRMAKDYAGAASLVPYIILAVIGLFMFM